ncbi:MAG: ATP-binding protein [Lentisphaerae bacterium]|nr:ATP-binding protein [Lentisphaerota bacterium]
MSTSEHPVIPRRLSLSALLDQKSHFLFGPRQSGKSFLISHSLPDVRVYNLLDAEVFLALSRRPSQLGEEVRATEKRVVIDEIQRLPGLLNEVHRLIEARGIRFLLTGSSARKLRRGGVNLLGGRARVKYLHPFVWPELGSRFDLHRALHAGLLPGIYFSDDADADLAAYAGVYLQEEIAAEGAARNVPAFSRFLRVAALCNARIVNFTNVANDAQVARTTVYEYFDILKDTLLVRELPAWKATRKRKPIMSSKYYFTDTGIARVLQGRTVVPGTPEYGDAVETYVLHELSAWSDYQGPQPLAYWRSTSGFEVDFILGDHTAIEVKAKATVSSDDLKGLRALAEESLLRRYLCVSLEPRPRRIGAIEVLPLRLFLEQLWSGSYA